MWAAVGIGLLWVAIDLFGCARVGRCVGRPLLQVVAPARASGARHAGHASHHDYRRVRV
jgi:hypothetical protein